MLSWPIKKFVRTKPLKTGFHDSFHILTLGLLTLTFHAQQVWWQLSAINFYRLPGFIELEDQSFARQGLLNASSNPNRFL